MKNADHINAVGAIVGDANVVQNPQDKIRFDHDFTGKYCGQSLAVVLPATTCEVSGVIRYANIHRIPLVPQGGNTGLAGGSFPGVEGNTIILSLTRMNRILDVNVRSRTAKVEAGAILDTVHSAVEVHDLTFPLKFGARGSCTIGGNLATNAGGSNVVRYGNARDLCLGLEVVLASGDVVNLMGALRKDNTGYDLKSLMIGSEGSLGIITAAALRLFPKPKAYATAMVSVSGLAAALVLLNDLQDRTGGAVEAFEYMPAEYFALYAQKYPDDPMPLLPPAKCGVLVEIGATADSDAQPDAAGAIPVVEQLSAFLAQRHSSGDVLDAVVARSEAQRQTMWRQREAALEVTLTRGRVVSTDVALPLDQVSAFLDAVGMRLPGVAPNAVSTTIAHLGDGNIHYSIWPNHKSGGQWDDALADNIVNMVEDVVMELGGSFSAEHGIGLYKLPTMARRKDASALAAMRAIKQALDPNNILNPGKVIPQLSNPS